MYLALIVLSIGILASCNTSTQDIPSKVEGKISTFTDNGAWCWFSDPRAIYYEGVHRRTYTGWVDNQGSIMVALYDHQTKQIEQKTLHNNLQIDDHNNPSLLMGTDGKLLVFYSEHSSKKPMLMAKAKNPESISEWELIQPLPLNDSSLFDGASNTYTYTNIINLKAENNKLFLFWRGTDFKPNFSTSIDQGVSWSNGRILILPERSYRNRRPYLKVASNNIDRIHFAFTDGHPRNEPTNSIYYARYENDTVYKADDQIIKPWSELPVLPTSCDLVYDAGITGEKAWIWDVAENTDGNPALVYSRFPDDSTHLYYYAIWANNRWNNYKLINSGSWFPHTKEGEIEREPNYSGGITLDHSDPSIVYMSIEKSGVFEIERWKTDDNGLNWSRSEITQNSEHDNIRPFAIRSYPPENQSGVLWMTIRQYLHYTDYDSSIKMYHY